MLAMVARVRFARPVLEGPVMNRAVPFDSALSGSAGLSWQNAVLRLGGGGLAALFAGSGGPTAAQEASPLAGIPAAGQEYLDIRQYQFVPDHTAGSRLPGASGGITSAKHRLASRRRNTHRHARRLAAASQGSAISGSDHRGGHLTPAVTCSTVSAACLHSTRMLSRVCAP